jgi:Ca2+/Na+ antiporter
MGFPAVSEEFASFLLLGGAAVAGYAAVRGAIDALLPPDDPNPAKRAVIHSAMTAIISIAAIFHHPALLDIAVGVPFSATIAAITLALGVVLFVAPPPNPTAPPISHRAWAFVLPTGLLTLLTGFTGELTLHNALVLAAEGGAILLVCIGPGPRAVLPLDSGDQGQTGAGESANPPRRFAVAQALFSLALALVAGWGMVQGSAGLALHNPAFRPGVAAVLALGPAIVLPMIPPLATLAERGRRDEATSAIVGFALINLCVVLPIVVVVQQLMPATTATAQPSATADLPFPILVWRLDTVLLSTIGLLLLPTAVGRWALSRTEGLGLVCVYVVYLFLTLLISHG